MYDEILNPIHRKSFLVLSLFLHRYLVQLFKIELLIIKYNTTITLFKNAWNILYPFLFLGYFLYTN